MQNKKLYATVLVLVVIVAIFSVSPAISSLMDNVVIRSTGNISTTKTFARSGSASDIQAAVNSIGSSGGTVHIPAGTWNFVDTAPWVTVNVPVGVNIVGAPTQRDADGQVTQWNTVLVMPFEAPEGSVWFKYNIDLAGSNKAFRFSDIKLVGYRFYNTSSKTRYTGISVNVGSFQSYPTAGITDFRVDHCCFQDMCGSAVWLLGGYNGVPSRRVISGVIDHNVLNNTYGYPGYMNYTNATLGYGIGLRRWACDFWDNDTGKVLGNYNNYTVFIENNYFSKWRHSVCANDGIHTVVRYNIFDACYGQGEVDGHGSYADSNYAYAVGTRAQEIYNNTFTNMDTTWTNNGWAINVRGGSGIVYNNTLSDTHYGLVNLQNDFGYTYVPFARVNQTYIWGNTVASGIIVNYNDGTVTLNTHYYLRAPSQAQDGFTYTPYPYPHPLTLK